MSQTETSTPPLLSSYRGLIRGKTRIGIAWFFVFLLAVLARQSPQWWGILLCFCGASLRFWASGFLRKDSHPAVGGPYAWVRNPLYLGTYLMTLGILWAIESYLFLAFTTVAFAAVYHFIILDEETKLQRIFGNSYTHYKEAVWRFWPRPWPVGKEKLLTINPHTEHLRFSWALANKNRAYEAYVSFAGLVLFVWAMSLFWSSQLGQTLTQNYLKLFR